MKKTLAFGATALLAVTLTACTGQTDPIPVLYGPQFPDPPEEVDRPLDDVYGPPTSFEESDDWAYDYESAPIMDSDTDEG